MYTRLIDLFSEEKLKQLHNISVLLVGVGGVGSFCFETLIRSGIQNITIIDFDTYEKSNLNRQLHSNMQNLGQKKVNVLKEYTQKINSNINIIARDEFLNQNSTINFNDYDYIIDACDNIEAKVFLIKNAYQNNIKIISALGIGNRLNIQDVTVTKIFKTSNDPLAKKLRQALKKAGIMNNIPVVCSKELPIKKTPISSYVGVTATAGILLADYVIKDVLNEKNRRN